MNWLTSIIFQPGNYLDFVLIPMYQPTLWTDYAKYLIAVWKKLQSTKSNVSFFNRTLILSTSIISVFFPFLIYALTSKHFEGMRLSGKDVDLKPFRKRCRPKNKTKDIYTYAIQLDFYLCTRRRELLAIMEKPRSLYPDSEYLFMRDNKQLFPNTFNEEIISALILTLLAILIIILVM